MNHLDLVGWINAARYKWAELTGKGIKFKPASFYLEVAARLAEEVEKRTWDDSSDREVLFSSSDNEDDPKSPSVKRSAESRHSIPKKKSSDIKEVKDDLGPPGTIGGGVD